MFSFLRGNVRTVSNNILRPFSVKAAGESASTEAKKVVKKVDPKLIMVKKDDVPHSPLKMKFLVRLVRDAWMPDALAQMKFSPKHRAQDIGKMLKRACALARLNYEAIPEELQVKEVVTNKGSSYKKLRIMGKGRTGVGYIRRTHVWIKVGVVDFEHEIARAKSFQEKSKWMARKQLADKLRNETGSMTLTTSASS